MLELKNAYQEELKMFHIYGDDFKNFKFHIDRTFIGHRWIWGLQEEYKILIDIIKNANLKDEELKTLYLNSIKRRKDLGLKDNMINMFELFVNKKYNELNEKINKRNNL